MVAADEDDEAAEPRRPNLFVRFLRIVFLTFLLVAVPLASAYAAYRITLHYGR
jgi:hypothetical protein